MGQDEFHRLDDDGLGISRKKGTSPLVVAYAIGVTILFVCAMVLLGIVYFDGDGDDDEERATVTPLTEFVNMDDPAYNANFSYDPVEGEVSWEGKEKGKHEGN